MKIQFLIRLCFAGVAFVSSSTYAENSDDLRQVERYIRCFDDQQHKSECVEKLADEKTPFALVQRGYELLYKQGSKAQQTANRKQAIDDFIWAAEQGYPPAYQALSIVTEGNHEHMLSWSDSAIRNGMGGNAKYLLRSLGTGSNLDTSVHLTLYSWVACHPASFQDTNVFYRMWEFGKKNSISDFQTLLARYRASNDQWMHMKKENFLQSCAKGTHYFRYDLPREQVIEGMQRVREKFRHTLERIKWSYDRFPDLRLLTRTEYFDLLPEIEDDTTIEWTSK
ncbi:hypothetical protein D3870_17945 [Noviherbaspirillum cavernae]|uniref:Sel1 repeat family protein n=1 Tax=Noviherbaspirillum cavernae TaxID=2320862 RepID=A0A418X5D3_9BURK|nr:hypothetical protein [Noviherbaspirillum cavernae]RJG07629.1 hypothetical protein D3870_17945 [Noviherbaspirillum cavernae]